MTDVARGFPHGDLRALYLTGEQRAVQSRRAAEAMSSEECESGWGQ